MIGVVTQSQSSPDPHARAVAELPDHLEQRVLAALELPDGDAAAALGELLAQEPTHAPAIRRWLRDAGVPGTWTGEPDAPPERPAEPDLPTLLGPYRILRRLGRGHFGSVFLAEQEAPFRRQVAVKVLNPGMDTRDVLARFAAEREALNRMDHPGIARLLDAGTTTAGRPFFVMEYVPGAPLARHCRQQGLPLRARLELFVQVLDAVQHAHQRAVIHRDLSTNNVLVAEVDGQSRPKVIDFGIAKSLASPLTEGSFGTLQNTLMGTPEFMSPEQARGRVQDIDTRTDIYALGVLLYELLTDTLPIPSVMLRNQGVTGMVRLIQEHQPPLPSQAAPAGLRAQLRGDLDWIALKALHKEPDQRYPTVGDFADDLRAWLRDEPIAARPPAGWERLRRFARRNAVAATAMLVMVTGLLAALLVTMTALDRARDAEAAARADGQRADERADAGFRLFAAQNRLREAREHAPRLWPAWPEQAPAMRAWLRELADPLVADLAEVRRRLRELADRATAGPAGGDARQLDEALHRLAAEVADFTGPTGLREEVRARLRFAETIERRSVSAHAEAWRQCRSALKAADGVRASTRYRGLQIPPQTGLVPLGANPVTMLMEFLDLHSHDPELPPPDRDAQTGALRVQDGTGVVFVLLPPGEFWMGARRGEPGMEQNDPLAQDDELPVTPVTLQAFLLARTELTQAQWARLSGGDRPSRHAGPMLPVDSVDWNRAGEVLGQHGMALPTEAQWEYACRAGTTTPWHFGNERAEARMFGWFGPGPQTVMLFPPNGFGLFDLHGNVAEWCRDWKLDYRGVVPRRGDGLREGEGELRVLRGGACATDLTASRSSARTGLRPEVRDRLVGLRPARALLW